MGAVTDVLARAIPYPNVPQQQLRFLRLSPMYRRQQGSSTSLLLSVLIPIQSSDMFKRSLREHKKGPV